MSEDFEILGMAEEPLGYDRIKVRCLNRFTRLCGIRGRMKRRIWKMVNEVVNIYPLGFNLVGEETSFGGSEAIKPNG